MSLLALVRPPSPSLQQGERSYIGRDPINFSLAEQQHANYVAALREAGAEIVEVAAAPELPDAVFIEDTALVLDTIAVIARPGAESRRAETPAVAEVLERYRPLEYAQAPATFDGGDILTIGRTVYIGRGGRTNAAGIEFLADLLREHDYQVVPVQHSGCLHLKSAVNFLGDDSVVINPEWVPREVFARFAQVDVDPDEPMGASALAVGRELLLSSDYPRTVQRIKARGFKPRVLDFSEFHLAEGGLTCPSIILSA
jgi:dimethylargininase